MASQPFPDTFYERGRVVDLQATAGETVCVEVKHVYSITVSPVMLVEIQTADGIQPAILKMFDRRFWQYEREINPYTPEAEKAWVQYVRSGQAEKYLESQYAAWEEHFVDEESSDDSSDSDAEDEDGFQDDGKDEDEEEDEDLGEIEASLFFEHDKGFLKECHAYSKLSHLQGRCIPRFIDAVRYSLPTKPPDLPARYFDIPGILIEYIPSFALSQVHTQIPDQPKIWEGIARQATEVAKTVNNAGVYSNDNYPRNYLVKQLMPGGEFQLYMVDFSMSSFREFFKEADDDPMDERSWSYIVRGIDNPWGIAVITQMRIKRLTGYKIEIDESELNPPNQVVPETVVA